MLYISRQVTSRKYIVVDTDDNSETYVTIADLNRYCITLGMQIEGVEIRLYRDGSGRCHYYINSVTPRQSSTYSTGAMARTKVFTGVEVRVYNNHVTGVTGSLNEIKPNTIIRLSDFGNECDKYIFKSFPFADDRAGVMLTVMLDDKIKLNAVSLDSCFRKHIALDMREVKNKKSKKDLIKYICIELLKNRYDAMKWLDKGYIVTDDTWLIDYLRAELVLEHGIDVYVKNGFSCVDEILTDAEGTEKLISKLHRYEFLSIAKSSFAFYDSLLYSDFVTAFVHWSRTPNGKSLLERRDYNTYVEYPRLSEAFVVLKRFSRCNYRVLDRFRNYSLYFKPTEEIKQAYVDLVYRTWKEVLRLYDEAK